MYNCPLCNAENPDGTKFCHKCGASFTAIQTGQLNADTILEGRYIIVKIIGRGGMGTVYLALDQRLDNIKVAIKEMSTNAVGGDLQAAIEAFKKEASILTKLKHPALPVIRDFFAREEKRWYLVMDYIEGNNLKQIVEKRGPIPETLVLEWTKQLCEILDYLHKQSPPIIFRDLKPSNIILTPENQIKLIDFGIARHFKQGNSTDTTIYGSHGFAPPEQYGKNQTNERSDIYSLGATLHYLLTGMDPHDNPFNFKAVSEFVTISPQFESAIMKSLDLIPENRPQTAKEMLNLLPLGSPKYFHQQIDTEQPSKKVISTITSAGKQTEEGETVLIDIFQDNLAATQIMDSKDAMQNNNPAIPKNLEHLNNVQNYKQNSNENFITGSYSPSTQPQIAMEYTATPQKKNLIWLIYLAPIIIAISWLILFFNIFPDAWSYVSSSTLRIVLYILSIAFITSLFFVGKHLNKKDELNASGAILHGKDAYFKVLAISDRINEFKGVINSHELTKIKEKFSRLEEQLRIETDFGCGDPRITNCENEIAEKINQLNWAVNRISDGQNFNDQISNIENIVFGLIGLIKRRREMTKK